MPTQPGAIDAASNQTSGWSINRRPTLSHRLLYSPWICHYWRPEGSLRDQQTERRHTDLTLLSYWKKKDLYLKQWCIYDLLVLFIYNTNKSRLKRRNCLPNYYRLLKWKRCHYGFQTFMLLFFSAKYLEKHLCYKGSSWWAQLSSSKTRCLHKTHTKTCI